MSRIANEKLSQTLCFWLVIFSPQIRPDYAPLSVAGIQGGSRHPSTSASLLRPNTRVRRAIRRFSPHTSNSLTDNAQSCLFGCAGQQPNKFARLIPLMLRYYFAFGMPNIAAPWCGGIFTCVCSKQTSHVERIRVLSGVKMRQLETDAYIKATFPTVSLRGIKCVCAR